MDISLAFSDSIRIMSPRKALSAESAVLASASGMIEVDSYGVPETAFGKGMPPEFYEILGRLIAVHGKIEYLKYRLDHLPSIETSEVVKFVQFNKRYDSGQLERNSIVHSYWVLGADKQDPETFVGFRYRTSKKISGTAATVSIREVLGSEREQVIVRYTLNELKKLLKSEIATMRVGEHALAEAGLNWAVEKVAEVTEGSPQP